MGFLWGKIINEFALISQISEPKKEERLIHIYPDSRGKQSKIFSFDRK
jgi:hypothetical protein